MLKVWCGDDGMVMVDLWCGNGGVVNDGNGAVSDGSNWVVMVGVVRHDMV